MIPRCMQWPDWKTECSSRFETSCRREVDLFVCFFTHRARLSRRHLGGGLPVACARVDAIGLGAEVKFVKTVASCPFINLVSKFETFKSVALSGETSTCGLAFFYARNAECL